MLETKGRKKTQNLQRSWHEHSLFARGTPAKLLLASTLKLLCRPDGHHVFRVICHYPKQWVVTWHSRVGAQARVQTLPSDIPHTCDQLGPAWHQSERRAHAQGFRCGVWTITGGVKATLYRRHRRKARRHLAPTRAHALHMCRRPATPQTRPTSACGTELRAPPLPHAAAIKPLAHRCRPGWQARGVGNACGG